jgi:sacsin
VLDRTSIVTLMHKCLLSPWQSQDSVHVSQISWFTEQWLSDLWQYLTRNYPSDLQKLENLHIFPVGNGKLIKLSAAHSVVASSCENARLDGAIVKVCEKLGITVAEDVPAVVTNHPLCWRKYLYRPDVNGVLAALRRIGTGAVAAKAEQLSGAERDILRTFIVNGLLSTWEASLSGDSLIRTMPVFRTLDGSGFQTSTFVSLSQVTEAAPLSALPVKLPRQVLDVGDNLVRELTKKLDIRQLTEPEALLELVFPAIDEGRYNLHEVEQVFKLVCDKWTEYTCNNSAFRSRVTNIKFIRKRSGDLASAHELFNENDNVLSQLFSDEDVFPTGVFSDSRYLHILQELGLKTQESVTAEDVLAVARKLDSRTSLNISCAKALLSFLETHSSLLQVRVSDNLLLNELRTLKWVLVVDSKPPSYPDDLAFSGLTTDDRATNRPLDILSVKHAAIIGSIKPLIETNSYRNLSKVFGWDAEPTLQDVVQHLFNVIDCYKADQKADFHIILREIYAYLDRNADNFHSVALLLCKRKWIFHSNGFAESTKMVMDAAFMDLRPYVYVMPDDLRNFSRLWEGAKIGQQCSLVQVLNDIAERHSSCQCADISVMSDGETLPSNCPCSESDVKRDLNYSICILNEVSRSPDCNVLRDSLQVPVNSPPGTLRMKPIDDCTYCDKEWFQQGFDVCNVPNQNIHLVHPQIALSTAEALNIHTICSRMMNAEELAFGAAYGQSEPLTRRLRNYSTRLY